LKKTKKRAKNNVRLHVISRLACFVSVLGS